MRIRIFSLTFALLFSCVCATAQQNSVPLIYQPLAPTATAPKGKAFTLTVRGTGFASGAVVQWNRQGRTTQFVSSSQLTATILASDILKAGTGVVTVVNPAPGGGVSNPLYFQVRGPEAALQFSRTAYPVPATGGSPSQAVAAGDFTGDGKPDLVLLGTGLVSILPGKGDGTFGAPISTVVSGNQVSVVVADFNKDGKLDLAIGQYAALDGIFVLLGKGDGTFQSPVSYTLGNNGSANVSVVAGDFNGDGMLDLAAADNGYSGANVYVLLGHGDGSFQSPVGYPAPEFALALTVGDFNGDGKLDLISTFIGDSHVAEFLGNGDGSFQPYVQHPAGVFGVATTVADFNGDGKLDLAVGSISKNPSAAVLLGTGDGSFQSPVTYGQSNYGEALGTGDFDADGILDLAVAGTWKGLSIFRGVGDGTFLPQQNFLAVNGNASNVATADFDGDGKLDVVAVDSSGSATVFLQKQIPVASLSVSSVPFYALQAVGTTSPAQTVTLTNTGLKTLNITSIATSGDFQQTNTCGSSVVASASCTISLTFTPTDRNARTGTLTVTDDSAYSPHTVALSGTGTNITLDLSTLAFGGVKIGTSRSGKVTATNVGHETVNFSSVVITGFNLDEFTMSNLCGSSLAPGASCKVQVTFTPLRTGGISNDLVFYDDGGGDFQFSYMTGSGGN